MTAWGLLFLLSGLVQQATLLSGAGRIGATIADFSLADADGQKHRLGDYQDRKLVVVVFLGTDCPLAKLYGPRLGDLARAYADRGVTVLGIHSNQHELLADLARYARDHHIPFPLLHDVGNVVADRFGAQRTPEAFVLDERRVIRYRGRIDDQYDVGLQRPRESGRYLVRALDELLAGMPVSQPRTEAVGCLIARATSVGKGEVTYSKDVAPILRQHCQRCHSPGQIGPFSLRTYSAAAAWAPTIREVIEQGRMPPWHANPKHGKFANDPSLSDGKKRTLLTWIDAGCPRGEPTDAPRPLTVSADWSIGVPDLVVPMPESFTVPAEGVIEYQTFMVDPDFTEDRWVQAAEIRPGNRAVVHHCNVFLQPPGAREPAEQGTLRSFCLAAMAAGTPATILPPGMAKRIPAGWRIVFVMHYTPIGSVQTDRTSIALKFADPNTVCKEVATKVMLDLDLCIPPHEANHVVSQIWRVNEDVLLLSMFPHMHLRGKSFCYEATYPDGETEILLDVPHYDFNWQHIYVLAEPKRLPEGTLLRCSAVYDNSASNPANPDPSVTVRTGPQSWDEMFNGYFDIVLADQDLTAPIPWHTRLWTTLRPCFHPAIVLVVALAGSLYLSRRPIGAWLNKGVNP